MAIAHSKLTAQGRVSVPALVRWKLGLSPGSVLEWEENGGEVVVRRVVRYSSEDIHRAIFPAPPRPKTLAEMKDGVRRYIKKRHSRH